MRTTILLSFAFVFCFAVPTARAQKVATAGVRSAPRLPRDPTALALARAIDARLTVWRTPSGKPIHVRHCRRVEGGCRRRLAIFARWMTEAAREQGVDPFLLAAIAMRESGLNPAAEGAAGERGIVQLHPQGVGYRVRFVRSDPYHAHCLREFGACQDEVLDAGAKLIGDAVRGCGGLAEGLGAYNSGVCAANDYADRVLEERARLIALAKGVDVQPQLVD
jgi:hypothetical protein